MEQVEEKLDEAAEASSRMGRKDWFIYFLGTVTALIITSTVAAGVGEHIFSEGFISNGYTNRFRCLGLRLFYILALSFQVYFNLCFAFPSIAYGQSALLNLPVYPELKIFPALLLSLVIVGN